MTKRKERKNERMNGWMDVDESRSSRGRNKEREEKGKS